MRSINKVIIVGNLTRDPEMKQTPNGQSITTFGIATNREWVTQEGDRKQSAEFHECVAWAKLAEICGQLLHKGDKVYLEGRLQTREWKGDDDQSKRTTEIVIDNMILLRSAGGYSPNKSDDGDELPKELVEDADPAKDQVEETEDVSDDIPF